MKYIIDTHSLVWYFAEDERLSNKARKIIQGAEEGKEEIILPAIVLLEAIDIQEKKKIKFDLKRLFDFIEARENFKVVPIDFEQIKRLVKIGRGLDLHDRVILTIAEIFNAVILTRDKELREKAKTIW